MNLVGLEVWQTFTYYVDLVCSRFSLHCQNPECHYQHCWFCQTRLHVYVGTVLILQSLFHHLVCRVSELQVVYFCQHLRSQQQQLYENKVKFNRRRHAHNLKSTCLLFFSHQKLLKFHMNPDSIHLFGKTEELTQKGLKE